MPDESTKSHLSETARFVLPFLTKITIQLRDKALINRANKIIELLTSAELKPEDPIVTDFILNCGDTKDKIIQQLIEENAGTKAEAVVRNYFSKFLNKEIKKNNA